MNKLIRKTNQAFIFVLSMLALATAEPLIFQDWNAYIWSFRRFWLILVVAIDEISISAFALLMIILSFSKKWRAIDYNHDSLALARAQHWHNIGLMLLFVGLVILFLELWSLH
jgi:hypothetical protein